MLNASLEVAAIEHEENTDISPMAILRARCDIEKDITENTLKEPITQLEEAPLQNRNSSQHIQKETTREEKQAPNHCVTPQERKK